jgi:hypothetical protein
MPFNEDAQAVPMEVLFSELSQVRRRELLPEAVNRLPAKFREVWSY